MLLNQLSRVLYEIRSTQIRNMYACMYVCMYVGTAIPPPSPRIPGSILKLQTPKINTCSMLDFQTSSSTLSSAHQVEFFIVGALYLIFPFVHNRVWVRDIDFTSALLQTEKTP